MYRILVLNNYPLDRVMKEVNLGETGDHLLFGINYFEQAGYSCEILPTWTQKTLPIKYKLMQKLFFLQKFW